ncbi:MAG: T9SS type A sorting domain-containing protein [Prevotella sp.]
MKKAISIFTLCLLAVLQMSAQRDWTPLTNDDGSVTAETVVYATLQDASGNQVAPGKDVTVTLGAFIGDECRAVATPVAKTSNDGSTTYIYTLRVAVKDGENNQTVNFVLKCIGSYGNNLTEYTLAETVTVNASDGTINYPSDPFVIHYTPAKSVSLPETITINKGDKVTLTDELILTPEDANLPDEITWDYGNSTAFINVENGVLEGLKVTSGAYLSMNAFCTTAGDQSAYTTVVVNQPITGLELSEDYPDGTITVNINDGATLTQMLSDIVTVTPEDATEQVTWIPSDKEAIIEQAEETTSRVLWVPSKVGTYTMTATCEAGAKVNVTVIIRKPVEELTTNYDAITVALGDEVKQYLPYTFQYSPTDATDPMSDISYSVAEPVDGESPVLQTNDDGTITAIAEGETTVYISHSDIPNGVISLTVQVIKLPTAEDFSVSMDPLAIEVPQDQITTFDITEILKGNIKTGPYNWTDLTWAENPGEGDAILSITNGGVTASDKYLTQAYGSTRFEGTMTNQVCGFDGKGSFTPVKEHVFTIGFGVNIIEGLSSISFETIAIGCEDTYQLTITTVPAGYPLEDVKFDIPTLIDDTNQEASPLFTLTRVEGTNTWTLDPMLVGEGELTATVGDYDDTQSVKITQHINAEAGWNWVSLYAGQVYEGVMSKYLDNAQEIRSQEALVYNDPVYGFFGALQSLDGTSCYKIDVKDDLTLDYLVDNTSLYTNTATYVTLRPGWNWFNNPCCKSHLFLEVFGKVMSLPAGSQVVAQNGFMTFAEEEGTPSWQGTLESLNAGQGYLIYNAGESDAQFSINPDRNLSVYEPTAGAKAFDNTLRPNLTYNYRQYADNMTIIARLSEKVEDGQYTVWAFVGDECRGEGKMINGRFFITVNGKNREAVSFKLFDTTTGEFVPLDETVSFTKTLGTYAQPLMFNGAVTGIRDITGTDGLSIRVSGNSIVAEGAKDVKVFSTNGQMVSQTNLTAGTYIVKVTTANGVVTKKMVVGNR